MVNIKQHAPAKTKQYLETIDINIRVIMVSMKKKVRKWWGKKKKTDILEKL